MMVVGHFCVFFFFFLLFIFAFEKPYVQQNTHFKASITSPRAWYIKESSSRQWGFTMYTGVNFLWFLVLHRYAPLGKITKICAMNLGFQRAQIRRFQKVFCVSLAT